MAATTESFSQWLQQAQVPEAKLTPYQRGVLRAAFHFRHNQGTDYYSTRLLSHFLLHADTGLKVAPIARLLHLSRPTASRQQHRSSKEAIQQAHHRMDGRPYGKLLPRYAGPIAQFLLTHPQASRADLLDFIDQTFQVRVSRIAVYKFLKKYGLDQVPGPAPAAAPVPVPPSPPPAGPPAPCAAVPAAPAAAPPFSAPARSTRAPSC